MSLGPPTAGRAGWSPWRVVVGLGTVSLAADMVYEGARSVYGPLLGTLGARALVVGAVTGAGEAAALVLRLVFGPLADRTRRYWTVTIAGYALTAVCVPLLALTPFLGGAGLAVAAGLILAERIGKAVRSPAKSALLADAAAQVGMGRGLGVHKALDQVGAFAGPLLVAALVAAAAGRCGPASPRSPSPGRWPGAARRDPAPDAASRGAAAAAAAAGDPTQRVTGSAGCGRAAGAVPRLRRRAPRCARPAWSPSA